MNRALLLVSSYLIDQLVGDPEWFPHPVRLIGATISRGEQKLRYEGRSARSELVAGSVLVLAVVGSSYFLAAAALRTTRCRSRNLGAALECFMGWTCLAARNLEQEANSVIAALQREDLPLARLRLSRIVGRDTNNLDAKEISRAVIETVAESTSDGIIAPLFYVALGGVPLAMAYKAINTLDSMIGHADDRYFYFGKVAARCDDAANLIPSRLSALSMIGASWLVEAARPSSAFHIWLRDGAKHKSPNAGQPESAMAGALHVALGGDNSYSGEIIRGERMGEEFPPANPHQAIRAVRIISVATILAISLFGLMAFSFA